MKSVAASSLFDALHELRTVEGLPRVIIPQGQEIVPLRCLDGARVLLAEDNGFNRVVASGILE